MVKNPPANARDRRRRLNFWVGRIPWKRKWQPTPVILPGKSHSQRSLVGYSPWGRKEKDTTEWLNTHTAQSRLRTVPSPQEGRRQRLPTVLLLPNPFSTSGCWCHWPVFCPYTFVFSGMPYSMQFWKLASFT